VREYLTDHPKAKSSAIADALKLQGIIIAPSYVANIKTKLKSKRPRKTSAAATAVMDAGTAGAETPLKPGDGIAIEQIKAVGQMVKTIGGFDRFRETLDVIRQVGGVKRFRDILEAMDVHSFDDIPF
jgi:hypothetical protein